MKQKRLQDQEIKKILKNETVFLIADDERGAIPVECPFSIKILLKHIQNVTAIRYIVNKFYLSELPLNLTVFEKTIIEKELCHEPVFYNEKLNIYILFKYV